MVGHYMGGESIDHWSCASDPPLQNGAEIPAFDGGRFQVVGGFVQKC